MNEEYVNQIRKAVKKDLSKERYRHTLGVAYTAASLAMRYNINVEKAYIAGLLHDCAKCIPYDEQLQLCENYNIEITESERDNPALVHAKLGAYFVKNKYKIEDISIYNAVLYHTTGTTNMSVLEKIIFLADYIEPHRNSAPKLSHIRTLAFTDIDRAIYEVSSDTLEYLKKSKNPIDKTTEKVYKYYKRIICE